MLFYTSVHILWLVKPTAVNDLECEIVGRGGGRGGVITNDAEDGFRRGKGSEFPIESISPGKLLGRRFVIEVECGARLIFDVDNIVPVRRFLPPVILRGTIGNWFNTWLCEFFSLKRAIFWRFRCSIIITQTRYNCKITTRKFFVVKNTFDCEIIL